MKLSKRLGFAVLLCWMMVAFTSAPLWGDDAVGDFSPTSNPNGVWSYGYSTSLGGAFVLHDTLSTWTAGVFSWNTSGTGDIPAVVRNTTGSPITWVGTLVLPPDLLNLHPGRSGQYSILRWTAPAAGIYQIAGSFQGLDFVGPTTTDVHVRLNSSTDLFTSNINNFNVPQPFTVTQTVSAGNTIDFAVGWGSNGNQDFDSTGLAATISLVGTPAVVSSLCGPSNPAAISGSTGEQGMLDPANTNASLGLDWGNVTGAAGALIFLDTGQVRFLNASNQLLSDVKLLPGISSFPAFADGKLNFTSVRLPAGKYAIFYTSTYPYVPVPVQVLSCQDVVLEGDGSGALATNGGLIVGPAFPSGIGSGSTPEGFGPRSGSGAAQGSLYSPVGGGGGKGPLTGCALADQVTGQPVCGFGGGALVVAAAGRITVNGFIIAGGFDASSSAAGAQGGSGGSVRLAAVLTEGVGEIDTGGGTGPGGSGLTGPIEIQAFVQNLFSGTLSGNPSPCTINKDCAVVAPIPDNLPGIAVDRVYTALQPFPCSPSCANTGSLTTPDITLSAASSPVTVTADVFTHGVPLGTLLTFRAVGTDGTVSTATGTLGDTGCAGAGPTIACANLTLNPGATYQIVVYPSTAFPLASLDNRPVPMSAEPPSAGLQPVIPNGTKASVNPSEKHDLSPLEKWARAFGVDPEAHKKMAQARPGTDHSK